MAREREEGNPEAAHMATISRWTRERERTEDNVKHMEDSLKNTLSSMLRDRARKANVAKELKYVTQTNRKTEKETLAEQGFRDSGESDAEIADYIANRGSYGEDE